MRADVLMSPAERAAAVDWADCRARLRAGGQTLGCALDAAALDTLIGYLRELARWNATYSLTAVRAPSAMVTHHLLDSLSVLAHTGDGRLADIGSGPGLPGLVVAIVQPQRAVTLVEVNRKKAAFLRHARRQLGLANVEVVQQRVETWRPDAPFATVICRAFAAAGDCLRLAGHLVAPDGRFVLMKGRDPGAELADLPPGFRHVTTEALAVPGLDARRHVAIVAPGLL